MVSTVGSYVNFPTSKVTEQPKSFSINEGTSGAVPEPEVANSRLESFKRAFPGRESGTAGHLVDKSAVSDGHQVAVKVSLDSSPHNVRARIRETELLRSTNHRNVMRLIACETVQETGQEVMILEYCQAGSVYSLLEQPTNSFGFQEKEFLTFLRDITEGVSYLNSLKIIHRDIKPGNILKKIEGDGSSTYVLTDFGAARELQDEDETFMSIYGTEEYILSAYSRADSRTNGYSSGQTAYPDWQQKC
ncbi:TBK1-like protein [Mya arenaria]|uniref:TBK1-like protein n=1 Tax=Mya arenaria TaxID=6604 RepID=A0ABY7FYV0_MYAAR|nr:TBK1-like protein [Mya arenaria]